MATSTKWKITEWEAVEEENVIVSLTTIWRTDGLTNTNGDNRTLAEALAVSGLPQPGDAAPGNTNLVCHRRTPRPVQDTPTSAEVVVEYKTVADWQDSFIFSGGTGLNQIQTDKDIYGNRITLSYTYPNDYPVEDLRGEVYSTSINESVYIPRTTLTATGTLFINYPTQISHDWVGHMNSTFWAGYPAGYWMCTNCDFTPRDVGAGRNHMWRFTWTFELNTQGWPVVAQIRDPNTGNIPDDVVAGTGTKSVDWYPSRDFNDLFGNT